MSYSEWSNFAYYKTGDIATFGATAYEALQANQNVVPSTLAPNWQVLPSGGGGITSVNALVGPAIVLKSSDGSITITETAPTDIDLTTSTLPLRGYFIDVALPPQVIDNITTDVGFDITPPFYLPDKHYQITWTTLFTSLAGTPLTGSIKWGVSQNVVPFTLPLNNQESSQIFDVAYAFTPSNAFQIIYSVSVSYLSEAAFPPNLTLWFEGTALSDKVEIAVREVSVLLLD